MISKVNKEARKYAGDFWAKENFDSITWDRLSAMATSPSTHGSANLVSGFAASIGLFSGRIPSTFVWDFSVLPFEILNGFVRLPWLNKAKPHTISGGGVELSAGSGFRLGDGYVEFPKHPQELFGQETCVVENDDVPENSFNILSNYATTSAAGSWVKATRESISPVDLKSAAAWAAGLAVTPRDGKLLGSATIPSGKLYVFDSFNLEVPYPHVELLPGIYPEGYVVCDNLEVRHIAKTDFEWWRDYPELRDGIPMSLLSPWDLFLPGQFDLEAYEEGPVGFEGKLHCRVYTEDGPDRVKYWAATKQAELATNTWLADIYGIEQLNEKRTLSAFEFLFGPDSVLKGRVTVVVTGNGVPSFARKRLYDFFHQERLVGSILIFIDRPANIIGFIVLGPNYWLLEPGQDPDIVRQNA